ncbi:PDR/VanB family oxidoreductase [Nocardia yamanashiensis]|uniref:PDR/VanB family oxidoreductase n=1 Tax=Nocardia yamanashiensis TaxID=209247 RepID=UPI001E34BE09|nr:PDR/VanB family oxidoreductase [Nocardia yamanashiensis]UGT44351.1 PDR/VanB family oxidoreductase [Nocardia yamanashiensis]
MTRAPQPQTIEGRIAEMRRRGVPPAFWAPLRRDPVLMVADKLIAPGARVLAWLSPRGRPPLAPGGTGIRELVLVDREIVAADEEVVSLVFAHPRGAALRPWRPGAHVDLVLPSGLVRQYSLCGDLDDPFHYRIAVRRIPGGSGSVELHDALAVGTRVGVRGPRNAFPFSVIRPPQPAAEASAPNSAPAEPGDACPRANRSGAARPDRTPAGGVRSGGALRRGVRSGVARSGEARSGVARSGEARSGVARSGVAQSGEARPGGARPGGARSRLRFIAGGIGITPILGMMRAAERAGLDWSLIYTGRHRSSLPFLDEISGYGSRVTVRTDDRAGLPTGTELVPDIDGPTAVYVCGPPALLEVVAARVAGAPGVELHCERFAPPPIVDGAPFTVQLGRGGRVLDVPADRTALSVVAEEQPAVSYSCRQGFCTTCKVRVLSGTVEHRDTVLNAAQRAQGDMLLCVSRAARGERLVLDVNHPIPPDL